MLNINTIRTDKEKVINSLKNRNVKVDINKIIEQDTEIRVLKQQIDELKSQRNQSSSLIAKGKISNDEKKQLITTTRELGDQIKTLSEDLKTKDHIFQKELLCIPNILDEIVPVGSDELDNQQVHSHGEIPKFTFQPKDHYEIAEQLSIMDAPRGVKLAQSRFMLLRGKGALLERAIAQYMLDVQVRENGYEEFITPLLVNSNTMTGTGQLPKFEEDLFKTTNDLYLIPTAEVPLTNIYANEIIPESVLPMQMTALTPCFRSEAGSYGKDTKGYLRQHQFSKVEMVWLTHPEASKEAHQIMTKHAENMLERLEIPYRTMLLCSGDIGFSASKCYDIECWLPSQNCYREISSCSNCLDFQARRANIRFKNLKTNKNEFVHTLNGSGLAVGRALIAVIENNQNEDGSINIPKVLQEYMYGLTKIEIEIS